MAIKRAFIIESKIRCPKCSAAMSFIGRELVHDKDNGCEFVNKRFKLPVIILEEVSDGKQRQ